MTHEEGPAALQIHDDPPNGQLLVGGGAFQCLGVHRWHRGRHLPRCLAGRDRRHEQEHGNGSKRRPCRRHIRDFGRDERAFEWCDEPVADLEALGLL